MVVPHQPFLLIPGCRLFTDVGLCGMLPGSRGFMGWEPPAGKSCGSRRLPRQADSESIGWDQACSGPGFGLFTYAYMVSDRSKGKGLQTGERVCVHVCGASPCEFSSRLSKDFPSKC